MLRSSDVNPRIINRAVNLARGKHVKDPHDKEPPWKYLTSEQPCIPTKNVDVTRRPLAFGKLAVPKLCSELHSGDMNVVKQAVTSFIDILHDPEKGYQALLKRVPDRMGDLLIHSDPGIREKVCMALTVIAGLANGKDAIVKNKKILSNLSLRLDDAEAAIRIKAAACLARVAEFWVTADELTDFGFVPLLLDCAAKDEEEIAAIHLETLKSLMYGAEGLEQTLENDGFTTFCNIMEGYSEKLRSASLNCLSKLLSTPQGKQLAYESNLLPDLNRLLHDERPEVYGAAASAIMFATIKSSAKVDATKVKHLPDRLVTLVQDSDNPNIQMHCLQALTNLCEHPEIREVVSRNYFAVLQNLYVGDDEMLKYCKNNLMKGVNWLPQIG